MDAGAPKSPMHSLHPSFHIFLYPLLPPPSDPKKENNITLHRQASQSAQSTYPGMAKHRYHKLRYQVLAIGGSKWTLHACRQGWGQLWQQHSCGLLSLGRIWKRQLCRMLSMIHSSLQKTSLFSTLLRYSSTFETPDLTFAHASSVRTAVHILHSAVIG